MMSDGSNSRPGQQRRRAADRHLPLDRVGLSLLVERHHHHAGMNRLTTAAFARKSASPSFRLIG
jgi:hypothetical protein